MKQQFLRTAMLLSPEAVETLRNCHVQVFGLGGVGSYSAEALARAGVGTITLIDHDTVSETNINRQIQATTKTVGMNKVDAMAERIHDIDPDCNVIPMAKYFCRDTAEDFFAQPCDYIIDAIDLVSCKLDLIEMSISRGIPIISAMGTGNKIDPTKFVITDISKTKFCPLARIMRKELRSRGITHHRVLYSEEEAMTPLPLEEPSPGRRSVPASVPWVPSCAGLMLAGDVIMSLINSKEKGCDP